MSDKNHKEESGYHLQSLVSTLHNLNYWYISWNNKIRTYS